MRVRSISRCIVENVKTFTVAFVKPMEDRWNRATAGGYHLHKIHREPI